MDNRSDSGSLTSNERRTMHYGLIWAAWTFLFAGCFLAGGRIFRLANWAPEGELAIALSFVPLIPGLLAFRAFVRFLQSGDEMLRAVLVEGLVFGFGLTMVFWGAIQLPEHVWLDKVPADWIVSVLLLGTSFGVIRAQWRRK